MRNEVPFKTAALRALRGRCPCCGKGKLYRGYLKQVEACAACGERFGHIRADDAAPWLTLIVLGHVFLPLIFLFNWDWMPLWTEMLSMSALLMVLALALLPFSKALFLAILWQTRAPGYQQVEIAS
jgi:uncharacterized protein (DUF983 family)